MIWLYWAIKRHREHRRDVRTAMREMRKNDYVAEWHDLINKRRRWSKYAA